MNLCYELLNEKFELDYGDYCNITIENILEYRRIIESLSNQEVISIYDDNNVIKNYHIIYNINFLDFSDKKIISKVYNDLLSYIKQEKFYGDTINISSKIFSYFNDLLFEYPYDIKINQELDFSYLLKSVGFKLEVNYDSFLEKFITYLDMYQKIFNINVFYTIDLSNYLTESELIELKKHIEINKILIINYDIICLSDKHISKRLLIDNDLCRII